MSVYSEQETYFPNLPGYRSRLANTGSKRSFLKLVQGNSIVVDNSLGSLPSISQGNNNHQEYQQEIQQQTATSLVPTTNSLRPKVNLRPNPAFIGVVLSFHAFFEEDVLYSSTSSEQKRIRICNINYYAENGMISVIEKQQVNSGIPQGTLVKKDVIYKSDDTMVSIDDLLPGSMVELYKRQYYIVGCDEHTKTFLESQFGLTNIPQYSIPYDGFNANDMKSNNSNEQSWNKHRAKKTSSKQFVEAQLGNYVDNSGREGFIKFGNQKLQFRCIWDNSAMLYGDVSEYSLIYHLSDDSVEIFSMNTPNSGRDLFSRLLRRSKLPKSFNVSSSVNIGSSKGDDFYKWSDLYVGMDINVYARTLHVVDADEFTRQFYSMYGNPLRQSENINSNDVIIPRKREIPPSTGFGSEEDSLRSCFGSLQIQPPHFKKLGENIVLSFTATMCADNPDDCDRKFVVMYYVQDGTLKILEPPIRNSGFVGGTFLSRRSHKLSNGEPLNENHLYVGARIRVMNNVFLLHQTNDSTLHWMEEKRLSKSNVDMISDKLKRSNELMNDVYNGKLEQKFALYDDGNQGVTIDGLKAILQSYDVIASTSSSSELTFEESQYQDMQNDVNNRKLIEHEVITLFRAEGNRAKHVDYKTLSTLLTKDNNNNNNNINNIPY